MSVVEIFLLIMIPLLNALGFVFWTQLVSSSWLLGSLMGILTTTTTAIVVSTFFDRNVNLTPKLLPFFILSSICFCTVEIIKMKAVSFSQPQLLSFVGLLTPILVVFFLYVLGYATINKYHIIGGAISMIGTAVVLYGGK